MTDSTLDRQLETLRRNLGPDVLSLLSDPKVNDIMLNPDGRLWVDFAGRGMEEQSFTIQPNEALMFMNTVANIFGVVLRADNPILECELPLDGSRFEAVVPPIVARPTFSIRKKPSKIYTLRDYVNSGILTHKNDPDNKRRDAGLPFHRRCEGLTHIEVIELAIRMKKNILVIGATGSGKTTFLNGISAAIAEIRPYDRMLIIEDTGEIICSAQNNVVLRATEYANMQRCLRTAMRLNPTSVSVGEARGAEIKVWIKACNTGHPGGFLTVHADDARLGLARVEALWEEDGTTANKQAIAEAINLIVYIDADSSLPAGRKVREVVSCEGFDRERGEYILHYV